MNREQMRGYGIICAQFYDIRAFEVQSMTTLLKLLLNWGQVEDRYRLGLPEASTRLSESGGDDYQSCYYNRKGCRK